MKKLEKIFYLVLIVNFFFLGCYVSPLYIRWKIDRFARDFHAFRPTNAMLEISYDVSLNQTTKLLMGDKYKELEGPALEKQLQLRAFLKRSMKNGTLYYYEIHKSGSSMGYYVLNVWGNVVDHYLVQAPSPAP